MTTGNKETKETTMKWYRSEAGLYMTTDGEWEIESRKRMRDTGGDFCQAWAVREWNSSRGEFITSHGADTLKEAKESICGWCSAVTKLSRSERAADIADGLHPDGCF